MSGASFRVDIAGLGPIEHELEALIAAGEDLTDFNSALGVEFESLTIGRFDREVDVDGNPLTPSVRAKVEGGKTLTDTGRYKGSITSEASASEIRVGTNVLYAAPNHFGAVIRAKDGGKLTFQLPGGLGWRSVEEVILPSRRVIGFGAEEREAAGDMFTVFFSDKAPNLFAGGSA